MTKKHWKIISFNILAGGSLVLVTNLVGIILEKLGSFHIKPLSEVLDPVTLAVVVVVTALFALTSVLSSSFGGAVGRGVTLGKPTKELLKDLHRGQWHRITLLVLAFLGVGMVVAVAAYGATRFIWWLVGWLSRVPVLDLLSRFNFTISLAFVLVSMLCLWIPSVFRRQSWKKLGDPILKWTGVSGVSVGGFGVIGLSDPDKNRLLTLAVSKSQVPVSTLQGLYATTVLVAVVAALAWTVGSAAAHDDNSQVPAVGFTIAFSLGWLSAVGMFTLCLDGSLLTVVGHLTAP